MTYTEYQSLNEADQLRIVIGSPSIATREENEYTILLTVVDDFFVELYFDMQETKVAALRPIKCFSSLEAYWTLVSIDEIRDLLETQDNPFDFGF